MRCSCHHPGRAGLQYLEALGVDPGFVHLGNVIVLAVGESVIKS
jgi:hypothetical protein